MPGHIEACIGGRDVLDVPKAHEGVVVTEEPCLAASDKPANDLLRETDGGDSLGSRHDDDAEYVKGHPVIRNGDDESKFLVSPRDDGDPALTFRSIVLGTAFTAFSSVITTLYTFKPAQMQVSVVFLQRTSCLYGKLPFGIKEHVVASLIASSGNNGLSGVEIYAVERLFCGRSVSTSTVLCSSKIFHFDPLANWGRLIKFGWALAFAAIWEMFPAYVMPWLGGISIFCLASIHATEGTHTVFSTIFGGASSNEGLGLLNFSFDWPYIQSTYLSLPFKQQLNSWTGYVVRYAAICSDCSMATFGMRKISTSCQLRVRVTLSLFS
ncbi:Oligopeptide transporter 4 [Tolypocladium capitatum]|uniref:Oligopeptide transporter 4 n=1 Tax=Tolypocladium capitatum TaxID=45235 RepID=A0A2K3QHM1_9HYPO|nr:Oligopeptide transporter 4 [Tolypocladium capitatum]